MFKKIFSLAIMALTLFFVSCEKANINGDPNSSSSGAWWAGTAPMSLEVNGVLKVPGTDFVKYAHTPGFHNIIFFVDYTKNIAFSIPEYAIPGMVYTFPDKLTMEYNEIGNINNLILSTYKANNGGCKITINNADVIEGYFYTDLKWVGGNDYGTIEIRKGYFKVNKK